MKTVLLKLSGPLQSWGTSSKFETRYTDYYPSKSAIIGMIAAAMGLKRDSQDIIKLNDIDFIVRVDQTPKLIRDYHIARKYKKNGSLDKTYVTNRYYLEDGVFVVAISHKEDEYLDKIYESLNKPYYQLYMGRRSSPVPADFILGLVNKNASDAIKTTNWQAGDWFKRLNPNFNADIYGDNNLVDGPEIIRNDRVISFSQKSRSFGPRYESQFYQEFSEEYQTNHDPFENFKER